MRGFTHAPLLQLPLKRCKHFELGGDKKVSPLVLSGTVFQESHTDELHCRCTDQGCKLASRLDKPTLLSSSR